MAGKSAHVSQPRDYKLIVEKDVAIPLRDGTVLYADVFRPDGGAERFPASLRVDIQPRDGVGHEPYRHFHADYNAGAESAIYAGGDKVSYPLVPIIPPKAVSSKRKAQSSGQSPRSAHRTPHTEHSDGEEADDEDW
jgi:hypothetical protein